MKDREQGDRDNKASFAIWRQVAQYALIRAVYAPWHLGHCKLRHIRENIRIHTHIHIHIRCEYLLMRRALI